VQQVFDSTAFSIQQASGGSSTQTITCNSMTAPAKLYMPSRAWARLPGPRWQPILLSLPTNTNGSGRWNATYEIGAASGSQTASWDLTGNTAATYNELLFGLRPTKSGTAPVAANGQPMVF